MLEKSNFLMNKTIMRIVQREKHGRELKSHFFDNLILKRQTFIFQLLFYTMEGNTTPKKQLSLNFNYGHQMQKSSVDQTSILWKTPDQKRQQPLTNRQQEPVLESISYIDQHPRKTGRGLIVTSSKKTSNNKQEEFQHGSNQSRRDISLDTKEIDLLRKELGYLRNKLALSYNVEKELKLQMELLTENGNSRVISQNVLPVDREESGSRVRFQKEHERLIHENWELRDKLGIQSLKRGELQNIILKLQSENAALIKRQDLEGHEHKKKQIKKIESNRQQIATQELSEQLKQNVVVLQESFRNVESLKQKLLNKQRQILMLRQRSNNLQSSWKQAVAQVKNLNEIIVSKASQESNNQHLSQEQIFEFERLRTKVDNFQQLALNIQGQLEKMHSFITELKVKNEETLMNALSQVEVIDQFRVKYQELQQIKQILTQQPSTVPQVSALPLQLSGSKQPDQKQLIQLRKENSQQKMDLAQLRSRQNMIMNELEWSTSEKQNLRKQKQQFESQNQELRCENRRLEKEKLQIQQRGKQQTRQMQKQFDEMTVWFNEMAADQDHPDNISRTTSRSAELPHDKSRHQHQMVNKEVIEALEDDSLKFQLQTLRRQNMILRMKSEQSLKGLRTSYQLQLSKKNKEHRREMTACDEQIGKLILLISQLKKGKSSKNIEIIKQEEEQIQ